MSMNMSYLCTPFPWLSMARYKVLLKGLLPTIIINYERTFTIVYRYLWLLFLWFAICAHPLPGYPWRAMKFYQRVYYYHNLFKVYLGWKEGRVLVKLGNTRKALPPVNIEIFHYLRTNYPSGEGWLSTYGLTTPAARVGYLPTD